MMGVACKRRETDKKCWLSRMYRVPVSLYKQLIDSLQDGIPKSLSLIGNLKSAIKGRLSANFYVDKWPAFSAVVGELIWPRRSDVADIACYATNSEAILSILKEGNLVAWGKRQEFQRIEDRNADFLLENLKCPGESSGVSALECIHERVVHYYSSQVSKEELLQLLNIPCPDGFTHGTLESHHVPMVTAQWPRLHGWPNKEPYFREIIENYSTSATFPIDSPDVPVSYVLQFPSGENFAYTMEEYRGKGVARNMFIKHFAKQIMDGYSPRVEESSLLAVTPIGVRSVRAGYNVKDLILKQTLTYDSKL